MNTAIHIISLGAGVQSSTMALMAAAGEITPMPVAGIFADTQAEPKSVYTWLDWLEKQLPFPVHRVTRGSLMKRCLTPYHSKINGKLTFESIPAFVKTESRRIVCMGCGTPMPSLSGKCEECGGKDCGRLVTTEKPGIIPRQCTRDFKIDPIVKEINGLRRHYGNPPAVQWVGISTDEIYRAKEHRNAPRITNRWPLMEMHMNRSACLSWMRRKGFPKPPRSACVFCPYHSDSEWRNLRDKEPDEFRIAVAFEKQFQKTTAGILDGVPFLHRSCKPLSEVDFSTDEERGQLNMFNNECEGMCGV